MEGRDDDVRGLHLMGGVCVSVSVCVCVCARAWVRARVSEQSGWLAGWIHRPTWLGNFNKGARVVEGRAAGICSAGDSGEGDKREKSTSRREGEAGWLARASGWMDGWAGVGETELRMGIGMLE